jgi:hypothetical protein
MARLTPLSLVGLLAPLIAVPLVAQVTKGGHPDLQGIWNYSSLTPLERPSELGSKEVLTDQEAAAYEKQRLEQTNADRRNPGTAGDVGLAYNEFWYDRGRRIVATKRTSLIVSPPDGRIPPLTAAAQKRVAAVGSVRGRVPEGPEDRSLAERCLVFNAGPPMAPGPYNNNFQLFQSQDRVIIMNEMIHNARVIPLDGRPHLPHNVRQWQGDSRGRWEGSTLIVDTTNFTDQVPFRGSDENLHLIERFTRIDADTLMYEFTIDDPSAFTKPWTVALPMTRMDESIYEYACHEGNYALGNILKGARSGVK